MQQAEMLEQEGKPNMMHICDTVLDLLCRQEYHDSLAQVSLSEPPSKSGEITNITHIDLSLGGMGRLGQQAEELGGVKAVRHVMMQEDEKRVGGGVGKEGRGGEGLKKMSMSLSKYLAGCEIYGMTIRNRLRAHSLEVEDHSDSHQRFARSFLLRRCNNAA